MNVYVMWHSCPQYYLSWTFLFLKYMYTTVSAFTVSITGSMLLFWTGRFFFPTNTLNGRLFWHYCHRHRHEKDISVIFCCEKYVKHSIKVAIYLKQASLFLQWTQSWRWELVSLFWFAYSSWIGVTPKYSRNTDRRHQQFSLLHEGLSLP